ncbi:hypothetical protein BH11PSE11_BH11PSE11_02790 [soil metagenome]
MSTSPLNASSLLLNLTQFKSQSLQSLLSSTSNGPGQASAAGSGDIFETLFANAKSALPTSVSNAQSGVSAIPSVGGSIMDVASMINGLEVKFKSQYSELNELKNTLSHEQEAAQKLTAIDGKTSATEIKSALMEFIATYNAGVNRFAPDVAKGGVLENSAEALRARFSTRRDIADPLIGAFNGLRGGLEALGITVDPSTGLASVDEKKLDSVLALDTNADVNTIGDFARQFMRTTANLNSAGNPQDKQLANLDRAIHWIADHHAAISKEFGPGEPAKPNAAVARAAAAYAAIDKT